MKGGSYHGRTALVVGAARSGVAASQLLVRLGARVILTDMRGAQELGARLEPLRGLEHGLEMELGRHDPATFRRCDFVVVSPGVPLSLPVFAECRDLGIPLLAEVELAFRHLEGSILAVTGSNGKTTTTVLAAELLRGAGRKAHAAGNVGVALTSFVADSTPEEIYVTELSSFQLESIRTFRADTAALLNVTPDHMDRYADFQAYAAAKERVFLNQLPGDFAVLNADDPVCRSMAGRLRSQPVFFSGQGEPPSGIFMRAGRFVWRFGGEEHDLFGAGDIALPGRHNIDNVMAASALALLAGAAPHSLRETIRRFPGVEHRLERVTAIGGVEYFNDSKATNVDSAMKALEAFERPIIWIAGGRDKGGDFSPLRAIARQRVRHAFLIGEAAGKIRDALGGVVGVSEATGLEEAVRQCSKLAQPGDVVLLAPACASFDMFENYEHRGRVFKDAVRALEPGSGQGM